MRPGIKITNLDFEEPQMSIQKKSLISALKTTKKANVASAPLADNASGQTVSSMKQHIHAKRLVSPKQVGSAKRVFSPKQVGSAKRVFSPKQLA
jgi:hypothetical protein